MKIFNTTQRPITFGTNERVVRQGGKLFLRNSTRLLREDLDWDTVSNIITAQSQKPKIYCYACSDGSEAYSIKLALIKKLGLKKGQEYAIEARDIDETMVQKAKSGLISLSPKDFFAGKIFMDESINKFFIQQTEDYSYTLIDKLKLFSHEISGKKLKEILSTTPKDKLKNFFSKFKIAKTTRDYKASNEIRQGITFNNGNLVQDAENIDFDNSVIFFRNVWPYLKDEDIKKLLSIFKRKFTDKTFLVLGYFDKKPKVINTNLNLPSMLDKIGLKEISPKIYQKIE